MACNSLPVFFGKKARSILPPGLDVTFMTDFSGSMQPYIDFITAETLVVSIENELRSQGIGLISPNRYSYTSGGRQSGATTLASIERQVIVDGVSERWGRGDDFLSNSVVVPTPTATGGDFENMGLGYNIISSNNRDYLQLNERVVIAGSDEQSYSTAFAVAPTYPHRYIGVHTVTLAISEPAGPNPIPSGALIGFVYTTSVTGVGIYLDGTTINYREDVPVANVTATAASAGPGANTLQVNVDWAETSNGAIYRINGGTGQTYFNLVGQSLARVLGEFLFASI